jgi:hypothetical protein
MNNPVIPVIVAIVFVAMLFGVLFLPAEKNYLSIQSESQAPDSPQILLQLQHRNSDGQIITYVEATKILFINPDVLNEFLDTLPNKKTIIKDNKKFELIQWAGPTETYDKFHSWPAYSLFVLPINGKYQSALMILHNAYQTEPGDTATVRWTVLRPIN